MRIDHHFSDSDILSGRISMFDDDLPKTYGSMPEFYRVQTRTDHQAYISETHIFSPTVVNEFRLGFARDYSPLHGIHNGLQVAQEAGIQGLITNGSDLGGVPEVNFNTFTGFSEAPTYFYLSQGYDLLDNLTWQKGKHSIKTGILIRYAQPATSVWVGDDFGSFTFNGFATASPSDARSFPGFDYADYLLGIPSATTRTSRQPNEYNRYTTTGVFVMDTWNVTPRLTVTAGLRWEYFMPPVDKNDTRYNFDLATGAVVVPSQVGLSLVSPLYPSSIPIVTSVQAHFPGRSLINGDWKDLGPRLSFAYRLSNRTVVRGGYGIYYAGLVGPILTNMAGGPFGTTDQYFNTITNGVPLLQFPNPFAGPPEAAGAQNVFGVSPSLVTPRTQQWNFSVERDLGHGNQPNVRASGGLRADCVANSDITDQSPSLWFNPGAFAIPATAAYGNCARGTIVGPGTVNFNLGIHKYFNLTEKARLQIQARATNVLNHPNFGNPGTDISSGQVGQIQSMQGGAYDSLGAAERQIRLGFRLDF